MTSKQRTFFFAQLWPAVCERRGWNPGDRSQRMEFFRSVLDTAKSFVDFSEGDFDRVKARCLAIIRPGDLNSQLNQIRMPRIRLIRCAAELIQCVLVYKPETYLQGLFEDRFGGRLPSDLDDRELVNLVRTLSRSLNSRGGLRNRAGDSLKEMRVKAGIGVVIGSNPHQTYANS